MPAYVTGQTKTFKSYGKKNKTHTANIRQAYQPDWNDSSPERATHRPLELSSSSDLSDDEWNNPPAPPKPPLRTPAKKKQTLAALASVRQTRAGQADKENVTTGLARVHARRSASAPNNKQLQPNIDPTDDVRPSLDFKGKARATSEKPISALSVKPPSLGPRRDPPRTGFIGVVIDAKARPRNATGRTSSSAVMTLSNDDADPTTAANHSWSKPSADDGGLSAKFGDLELTDSDDEGSDGCEAVPTSVRAGSSQPRPSARAARQTRKTSSKSLVLISSEDEAQPAPTLAPLRSPRHTRSTSASSCQFAPPPSPPKPTANTSRTTSSQRKVPAQSRQAFPALLKPLLSVTSAGSPARGAFDFTDFVRSPPAPLCPSAAAEWRKVGEASYSEVFSAPGAEGHELVVKIIPISPWAVGKAPKPSKTAEEVPFMSEWHSAEREVALSSLLGGDQDRVDGFVKFKGAFLVQGSYPTALLAAWDEFKQAQSPPCDDQIKPHVLPPDQVYMMIILAHGGRDLESCKLKSWVEAASVLWQVTAACARAEEVVEFEHRDLHWGNVLVRPTLSEAISTGLASLAITPRKVRAEGGPRAALEASQSGVEVTLIDFTLSRAVDPRGSGVLWDGFEDECVFEGEGDAQFDVYRSMRDHVKDDWEGYHPLTNLMWIHHLSTKLLTAKKLRKPAQVASRLTSTATSSPARRGPASRSAAASLSGTPRRALKSAPPKDTAKLAGEYEAWSVLKEVEEKLSEALAQADKAGRAKARKGRKVEVGWGSAGDLVAWWSSRQAN